MNLYSILERAAGRWPEKTALVHAGRAIAYRELDAAAGSLAARLVQSGVRPGDKVAIMCPRSAEFVAAFFAVLRAGAIAVTVPPELKAGEVAALAEVMLPDAFCYGAEFAARVPGGRGAEGAAIFDGGTPLCVRLAAARATPQSERDRLGALDLACIAFSSGTSARAKGILFSHRSLFERAELCRAAGLITGASSLLWLLALNRVPYQICFSIMIGAKVVIADSVDTGAVPRLIREHAVDQVYAGPLFYRLIVQDAPAPEDIQNVKYFFSLGSALPEAAAAAFRAALGREILQWYALTELSPVLGNISEEPAKRGSVGKVAPGRELKLAGDPSEAGGQAAGEVLIRGPGMFDGYYKPWRPREEILEDGWFRTGDVARRDADGYYWIVGRTKDVINVGGVKVFPYQLEEILAGHPAVEEALVYGAPEPRFGEAARAKVKLRPGAACGEKEILEYANAGLSVFKRLRGLEFVDEIPRTVTGKPRRWTA